MSTRVFTFLALCLLLVACKKDTVLMQQISGAVSVRNINTQGSAATVKVYSQKLTSSSLNNGYTLLGTTTTDAQGKFTLSFERLRTAKYKITAEKANFFSSEVFVSSDLVEKTTNYVAYLSVYPKAELELIISNVVPATPGNYLGLKPLDDLACACCFPDGFTYRGVGDTTIICDWYGAQNFSYKYTKSNEEGLKQVVDSLFLNPFERNTIQINF